MPRLAKTVPFLAIIANPVPSCAHLPSVCLHMRFPRSAPTQDAKGQTQCKDRGSSSTVHQNRLFDDARPCEARMMHFEATNDDIKGSYQFISIVYLDQVHRIYIVWCGHILPTSKSYFPSLKSLWMNIGWIAYIYIYLFFFLLETTFRSFVDSNHCLILILPGENCWNSLGVETRRSALQPQQRWDWDLHP